MAKIDIYTYFNAEQTQCLLVEARSGTREMLKYLKRQFPQDFVALTEAIADCMPMLVFEDRLYKSGAHKGQRKIVFRDLTEIENTVSLELTGVNFKRFSQFRNYTKKSMIETVLTPPENSIQYSKTWIKSFLDTNTDFSDLRPHYAAMTTPWVARAKAVVDAWIQTNQPDMNELMTWDGNKFNEWHFANREAA